MVVKTSSGQLLPPKSGTKVSCHTGNILVFSWHNLRFWGGGWTRGAKLLRSGVNLDLTITGHYDSAIGIRGFEPVSLRKWLDLKLIHLPTSDGDGPNLPYEFWVDFIADMEALAGDRTLDILIFCVGGHGRTGTVLATLAGLCLDTPNPVQFVRDNYCEEAVETFAQVDYIKEITGLEFIAAPSMTPVAVTYKFDKETDEWESPGEPTPKTGKKVSKELIWEEKICLNCEYAIMQGSGMTCAQNQTMVSYDHPGCKDFKLLDDNWDDGE